MVNNDVKFIFTELNNRGFASYIVGGAVRDNVLGNSSSDIDIATSATPNQVIDIFNSCGLSVIPVGIEHGTVKVLINDTGYEITTFRKDIACLGRGAVVSFTDSIEEDLSRRDFTANAIAYCPLENKYIDPFNGMADIEKKIIRTVGNPHDRFREDYLRMFRAFRFSSTLNFSIHNEIMPVIKELSTTDWQQYVSPERIKMELDKCLNNADTPSVMFENLRETGLLKTILPELDTCYGFVQNKYHKHDVFYHTLYTVDAVPKKYPLIRYAALFHDLGKVVVCENYDTPDASFHKHEVSSVELATNIMDRLKFSNKEIDYINNLISHHMSMFKHEMKDSSIRRFICSIGKENVEDILIFKRADRIGNGSKEVAEIDEYLSEFKNRITEILLQENAFKITDLAINGTDVMSIKNIPQGKLVGDYLKKLFDMVLETPELNTREKLEGILNEI